MNEFTDLGKDLLKWVEKWEKKLQNLPEEVISQRKNKQKRTVKQILGHMIDSASNNTHRIIHLQYRSSPCDFPDYANLGNNDRWIAIQNYQDENWNDLIQLWKYSNYHIVHVISNINPEKLNNVWISALKNKVTLQAMVVDYPRHFKLHLDELDELISM